MNRLSIFSYPTASRGYKHYEDFLIFFLLWVETFMISTTKQSTQQAVA